ncbi:UPF0352 protein Sden_2336 [Moritella viscosa]|nr:UPF0352 protein Sden_2336 [Moritella viscosa]SGY96261.1 UPF0352 protein Sden_2336 [Moritella viscosa]SHO06575.1 UPF0352 protein Sden_2336 [Moritella viscosa]SHO06720.1 UPF0352 protein Sden_2336 [Moritella viscosa]SHO07685.1 UPF0352 protein Sden_2336 [Moritella viscosa]
MLSVNLESAKLTLLVLANCLTAFLKDKLPSNFSQGFSLAPDNFKSSAEHANAEDMLLYSEDRLESL